MLHALQSAIKDDKIQGYADLLFIANKAQVCNLKNKFKC